MVNIARGQRAAERLMITPCRIDRIIGVIVDPETGMDVPEYADPPPYVGNCKVQDRDVQVSIEEIPGGTVPVQRLEVHVPATAGPFEVDDVVQILDGTTVIRSLRVIGVHIKTFQTAQRLPVEVQP